MARKTGMMGSTYNTGDYIHPDFVFTVLQSTFLIMGAHTGFTIILWVAIGLFVFNQWENRKKKKK